MNPLTNVKNVNKMNQRELEMGVAGTSTSWHAQYKDSAWVFVGGLPYELSEGDVLCVFSQYGEIVNINMVRDPKTGKPRGFCFICYEDQRSTILTVDNLNGIKILNRTIRIDHVNDYKLPKEQKDMDEMTRKMREEGCAPRIADSEPDESGEDDIPIRKPKKEKKKKKKKKKSKRKRAVSSESDSYSSSFDDKPRKPLTTKVKEKTPQISYDHNSVSDGRRKGACSPSSEHRRKCTRSPSPNGRYRRMRSSFSEEQVSHSQGTGWKDVIKSEDSRSLSPYSRGIPARSRSPDNRYKRARGSSPEDCDKRSRRGGKTDVGIKREASQSPSQYARHGQRPSSSPEDQAGHSHGAGGRDLMTSEDSRSTSPYTRRRSRCSSASDDNNSQSRRGGIRDVVVKREPSEERDNAGHRNKNRARNGDSGRSAEPYKKQSYERENYRSHDRSNNRKDKFGRHADRS